MKLNPFVNATLAALYIAGVVSLISSFEGFEGPDNVLMPMALLSLLVLSVAVMGFLFFYEPLRLYFENEKEKAVPFFLKTLATFACFALVFFVVAFSYSVPHKEGSASLPLHEPYRATLTGEYVCLPHVDTSGAQTDECASGLLLEDNSYVAVDFALMSHTPPPVKVGDTIRASGVVTPVERLSTDHWRLYPVTDIFSVTDSVEVVK